MGTEDLGDVEALEDRGDTVYLGRRRRRRQ